jgi:hypothetical protein
MPLPGALPDPRDRWIRLQEPLSYHAECATVTLAADLKCALGLRHYCSLTGLSLIALKNFLDRVEEDTSDDTLTDTVLDAGAEILASGLGMTLEELRGWEDGFDTYNDTPRDLVIWQDLKHAQTALGISPVYMAVCNE